MVRIPLCNSTRFGRGQSLVSAGLNNSPEGLKNSAIASSDRASILKQYITYGQGSAVGAKMSSGSGLTPKSRQFSRRARAGLQQMLSNRIEIGRASRRER